MRNGVILNCEYKTVLELEALNDGFANLSRDNSFENVELVLKLKKTYDNRLRQKLFQTILLYDEFFVFDPLFVSLDNIADYIQINCATSENIFIRSIMKPISLIFNQW